MRICLLAILFASCAHQQQQHYGPTAPAAEPYSVVEVSDESQQQEPADEFGGYHMGIVLLGDTGSGGPDQYKVARGVEAYCEANQCDMGLLLGDNFYEKGVKSVDDPQFRSKFEEPYKNLRFKFYPVLGNHDIYGNWQAQIEYKSDHWDMLGRWYSMEDPFVSIYALDTRWLAYANPFKPEQRKWIEKELAENDSTWTIVYGHYPIYSSGAHGDTGSVKKHLAPLLKRHKVDFYISGHDHDKELIERDGVAYIVSGAGAKLRPVSPGRHTVFARSSLGFAHLLLADEQAMLRFVDADGRVEFEKVYPKHEILTQSGTTAAHPAVALPQAAH